MEDLNPCVVTPHFVGLHLAKVVADHEVASNVVLSPTSLSSALAMTLLGAGGTTEAEMRNVLGLHPSQGSPHAADFPSAYRELVRAIQAGPGAGYQLNVANRLFGLNAYPWDQGFIQATQDYFAAPIDPCDFTGNAKGEQERINKWVFEQTAGKVTDLVSGLDRLTRLVLVNAVYFKGSWLYAFDENKTRPRPFHVSQETSKDVPFMHAEFNARTVGHTLNVAGSGTCAVELPYQGSGKDVASMMFFLPPASVVTKEDHESFASKLPQYVTAFSQAKDSGKCVVTLPKFKVREQLDGKKYLDIPSAYSAGANFSKMTKPQIEDLYISDIFHQAVVEVNEEGTEAAAASAVVIKARCRVVNSPPSYVFDRPFYFAIVHRDTGAILFAGRVSDPSV